MKDKSQRSSFDTDGYLSDEAKEIVTLVSERFGELFDFGIRANKLAHSIRRDLVVSPHALRSVVSACLLMRGMDAYQACLLLARSGLAVEAGVLLRVVLEVAFLIKNLADDKSFVNRYVGSHVVQRKRLGRLVLRDDSGAFRGVNKQELESLLKSLEGAIRRHGFARLGTEELAKSAGLHGLYQTAYRTLSDDVHVLPGTLNRFVQISSDGRIIALDPTPKTHETKAILGLAIVALMISLDAVTRIFGLKDHEKDVESIYNAAVTRIES